jgi:lysophospholipid acyltransferase (LPLAT)-like uncharacterized protein
VTTADKPHFTLPQRLILAVLPRVAWAVMMALSKTWRYEVIAEEGAIPVLFGEKASPAIFCFWHQCLLPSVPFYRKSGAVVMISGSFDGEIIARTSALFGYGTARGSSSRDAQRAFVAVLRCIKAGRPAIFTADGPRGPIYQSKMGPIKLAQMTGAPIASFHQEPERAWGLHSWDRFFIPKPFTRVVVSWARPVHVPTDLAADGFEPKRQELDAALERARLNARKYLGKKEAA